MEAAAPRPRALRDPLLERDYLRICSRPSSFRSRTIAAGLAVAAVGIVFAVNRGERPDVLGRSVHGTFAVVGALVALWMALAETATAIPSERSGGTLPLLLAAPIPARRLAAGFLGSRIAYAGTVLLGLLPVEGMALLMGGVSGREVLLAAAAIATAALWGAGVGLLGGAGATDSRRGLGGGLLIGLTWMALLPLLAFFAGLLLEDAPAFRPWREWARPVAGVGIGILCTTPAGPVLALFGGVHAEIDLPRWAAFAIPGAVGIGVCLLGTLAAGRRLGREADAAVEAGARDAAAPGTRARPSRPPRRRALAWKESRPPRAAAARWSLRIGVALWTLLLGWLWFDPAVRARLAPAAGARPDLGFYEIVLSGPLWALLLFATAGSATFVAEEREKGSLDILRSTPIPAGDFVLARSAAALARLRPLLLITGAFAVAGVLLGIVGIRWIAAWLLGFGLAGPALVLGAFALGSRAATVRVASRMVGLLFVTLLVGWPVFTGVLACLTSSHGLAGALSVVNPLVSVCGPTILLAALADGVPGGREAAVLAVTAAGTLGWGVVALVLWSLRHRLLDRAFHGADG